MTDLEIIPSSMEEIDAIESICLSIDTALKNNEQTFHFSQNYIVQTIPPDIKLLRPFLQILHIEHCYELTHLPTAIGELIHLRWLNVSYNKLTELPAEIGKLRNVERLHVNNNMLESIPTEVWNMKALQELRCDSNRLKGLPTGVLSMRNLQEAFLNNNLFLTKENIAEPPESGLDGVVPPLSQGGGDCSNCRGRILKGLTHVTFHDICKNSQVPVVHYCCSARCLDLLRRSGISV